MATFEQNKLARQVLTVLENLRRDMRANAAHYLELVAANRLTSRIISEALANTAAYDRLLDLLQAANANAALKAKVQAGLTGLNMTYADVVTHYQELRAACDAEQLAEQTIATAADVTALANATLANVAPWDSIWPE